MSRLDRGVAGWSNNALLVVDRRFIPDGASWLTEGPVGPETGERYLQWFDTVTVAGREGRPDGLDSARLNRVEAEGLDVVFLPNLSGVCALLRNRRRAQAMLAALIAKADCVIARMPGELPAEAARIALATGKPLALDIGGCVLDGLRAHGSLKGKVYAPLAYQRMRNIVRRSAWVSYVTQDFLQGRYPAAPEATTVACSNVDIAAPDSAVLSRRMARIEGQGRPLVFGTIGSLHGRFKGIQHALAALDAQRDSLPAFQYRVLGGGDPAPWRGLAEHHGIADRVHFDGTLPSGGPVHGWLDGIDVYLHPSLREGVPRALIEAMSRGCPSIASSVAGTPELLTRDCLHAPGDVDALARLIARSVDPEWQRQQAERNGTAAGAYAAPVLGARRDAFWRAFAQQSGPEKRRNDPNGGDPAS